MHPAYFETRFRLPGAEPDWPAQFVIVSAYATTGQQWTDAENQLADRRLEAELLSRGGWRCRVTGYSPTTGHAEPSFAADIPLSEARQLGARFHQDAIYHVAGDQLSVVHCQGPAELVAVGPFRERVHAGDGR
jgi:hypothetical protein